MSESTTFLRADERKLEGKFAGADGQLAGRGQIRVLVEQGDRFDAVVQCLEDAHVLVADLQVDRALEGERNAIVLRFRPAHDLHHTGNRFLRRNDGVKERNNYCEKHGKPPPYSYVPLRSTLCSHGEA